MRNLVGVVALSGLALAAAAGEHPRLLFGPGDVAALREKIKQEPYKSMYEKLVADVDKDNWSAGPAKEPYDESTVAERAAFLYVLTGDDSWAKKSREMVEKRLADGKYWANAGAKGLSLYYHGSKVALAYDWCHGAPSWDAAFGEKVSQALKANADVVYKNGGKEQNNDPASNWQGGRYGSAGLGFLASDQPVNEADLNGAYEKVCRYMRENVGADAKSRGWNAEGLGYTYYPMGNFVGPFAVAMQRKDPAKDLRKVCAGVGWTLWTCYAVQTRALGNIRPDFGDDNPGTAGEGTYGLAFWFCPEALHPGLVYVFERLWGAKGNKSFDSARGGTPHSILFHPGTKVAEKDPLTMPEWREGFADTGGNGYFTYRNRYQDEDDAVAQLYVKLRGNRGHNGPDALSFRILGQGTAWAVGGGRYGTKHNGQDAYWRSMNTLYPVDPDEKLTPNSNSGKVVGASLAKPDGGGHVIAEIAANNVGAANQKRWFIADFGKASGAEAVYVICDTSDNGKFWQLCTYEPNRMAAEGNAFTITAENGSVMKGTVLYPAAPKFKTGQRPRGSDFGSKKNNTFVHFQSDDGCHLVVLTCVKKGGTQPAVSATGTWGKSPNGTVKAGGFSVTIKGDEVSY